MDEFNDLVSNLGRDFSMSFIEVEHLILERTQEFVQKLLKWHALDQAMAKETDPVSCLTCENVSRPWRKRGRQIVTLCGERWMYYCEDKHYHYKDLLPMKCLMK